MVGVKLLQSTENEFQFDRPQQEERCPPIARAMKFTGYFTTVRTRPDRAIIEDEWILRVITRPEAEERQADGRIRRWARIPEMDGRCLRVILLSDGETVHNAFFDRGYTA